ncbi:hypothetical protein MBLNU457_3893t1 [Dothideomycetes sp. NU457]
MASEKRKAAVADRPSKRSKADQPNGGSSERTASQQTSATKPKKDIEAQRNPVKSSILQAEDRAFPRGGADVLTPLERRQIKIDAERDVLFEQSGQKKPVSDEYGDEDDLEDADEGGAAPAKKRKKTGKKKTDGTAQGETSQVKVQGLSYKTLAPGCLVLGQVTAITSRDVALALPNNLTGFIPLTSISDRINQRIEALLNEVEKEADADEEDDNEDIDLRSLFYIGQYLRAHVTSTSEETTSNGMKKTKRRIELSVEPKLANAGFIASDVKENFMVQASVRSVEDHGLVMDLGLDDDAYKGFVSKKELGKSCDIAKVQEGQVMLCNVTGTATGGKVIKLCPDTTRMGDAAKHTLTSASTIDAFVPGTAVEVLVTEIGKGGMVGKIMGMLDATADIIHAGAGGRQTDAFKKTKAGQKIIARVICTFHTADSKKVGVSLLENAIGLKQRQTSGKKAVRTLESSEIVEEAKVIQVEPAVGVFFDLGIPGYPGYAHISKLSDGKIDALFEQSGEFKLDSVHRARVIGFNPIDGVYNLSLQKSVLEQAFLKLEDVQVGQHVQAKVEKIILGAKGITGVLVNLAEGVSGLIPHMHMSDVVLQHPEKRFREGFPVKARVLSVDPEKHQLRLTAKKTLVNSDAKLWKEYTDIQEGDESPGTIIIIKPNGALVQFYGNVRGWLPVAEMSEAYISDPNQHFRVGQTVNVRATLVEAKEQELRVSCKDPALFSESQQGAWDQVKPGQLVTVTVVELAADHITVNLQDSSLKATLRVSHLSDGSESKNQSALKQIRAGQKLADLVVLDKVENRHLIHLSNKPSLVKAAKSNKLIVSFDSVKTNEEVSGFVRNITPDGVFIEFGSGIVGYLPKSQVTLDKLPLPAFGLRRDQSITARIASVDTTSKRFSLSQREEKQTTKPTKPTEDVTGAALVNAVDGESKTIADFSLGKLTQARIVSVKDTQLNVQLADNIQGRVDVSEAFGKWDDINDRKHPLRKFKPKQVIPVRILGVHDARNHRFLPISHRQAKIPVFELTAKVDSPLDSESDLLTVDKIQVGSSWVAYVNNITDKCLWVNLSPNVRGRIDLMDVSDDVSLLQELGENFPVGSALKVKVKAVDAANNRLDLTAASGTSKPIESIHDVSVGMIVAGKIFKVTDRSVTVALSDKVNGAVPLTEMADDLEDARPGNFNKNDIIRACVVDVDVPNKRLFLSVRPSKILSSSLSVEDPSITSLTQLKVSDIVRGFVKLVRDNGIIVALGPRVEAFVRISDLSDAFIKDWKSAFEVDQLVKGKILSVDPALNHVQMSLKASHVDKSYVPPQSWSELETGDVVTGKVRKVEDFGVFIDVDNTQPRVSGLCHRSQIADKQVVDIKKLYDAGDVVKAKILSIDMDKKRISFGLKASLFQDQDDVDEDEEMEDGEDFTQFDEDEASDEDGGVELDLSAVQDAESEDDDAASEMSVDDETPAAATSGGLKTTGFDWTGDSLDPSTTAAVSDTEGDATVSKKRKRKAQTFEDKTGDLDANGPQSNADYERLLLTSPHSADLWIQYMAFQLRLSEVQATRDIGRRALRTIHMREMDAKLDVWIALLNLEVSYGDEESVAAVFNEAVQVQDPYTVHERMAEIWTAAGRIEKADEAYAAMAAKKEFRTSSDLWVRYATFLFEKADDAAKARGLLSRALLSVHEREKRALTSRFAGLEFKTSNGDAERGRTIFEGLVAEWPKWTQGWDMWVDLERGLLKRSESEDDEDTKNDALGRVRGLFERMTKGKMKKRRARFVFKRWLEFEEQEGTTRDVERVKALAKEYVEKMAEKGEEEDDE